MKTSFIYILSNSYRTTFYIGVTNDLKKRIIQHKTKEGSKFTARYNIADLIYFEEFTDVQQAIAREKQLKNWKKEWKLNLIEGLNPKLETLNLH